MKELVRIKPNNEIFKGLGVNHTQIDEIIIFSKQNKVELSCGLNDCKGFDEIAVIEENLKKKFGKTFDFKFNINYMRKEISTDEIKLVVGKIIEKIKKESAFAMAYLSMYRKFFAKEDTILLELKHDTAKEKLYENNMHEKISNEIRNTLGLNIKIEFQVGDFSKEIKEIDEKSITVPLKCDPTEKPKKPAEPDKPKFGQSGGKKYESKGKKSLIGREIKDSVLPIKDFNELYVNEVFVTSGEVFGMETRETSTGKILLTFNITDRTDSLTVKSFLNKETEIGLKNGMWVKIKGKKQQDRFNNNEDIIFVNNVNPIESPIKERKDTAEVKRVELHAHTKMSSMDSVADMQDIVKFAGNFGHKAIAITDHGVAHAFPFSYKAGKKFDDFKVIFGTEGYLVDDSIKMVKYPKDIPIEEETYVVFDIETTGFDPYHNKIIEIGAVKLDGNKVVDRYSTFINPQEGIPQKIIELTGITNEMVNDAPLVDFALKEFLEFVGDATVVAHNANFDVGFITQKCLDINIEFNNSVIDTLQWSRTILKDLKRHNLKALAKYLGVSLDNHHRAVDDAEATSDIFIKLINMLISKNIYKLTEIDANFDTNIKGMPTHHIIILAQNQTGLKNLYKLISEAHINYFHRNPRIPKSLLTEYREGLILGSACESGELIQAYLRGKTEQEIEDIAKYYDYLEIQPDSNNQFLIANETVGSVEELHDMNKYIYNLGKKLDKPVVATGDVHYLEPADYIYRSILMYGKGFKDFDSDSGLYFRTTNEMLREFSYLGEEESYEVVVKNTNMIADMIDKIQPVPDGFYPPKIEGAEDQVRQMTYDKAKRLYGDPIPEHILARIDRELNSIINNGFAVLYLIAQKLVKKSLDNGYLVGSRGSVGSSIVAFMMDITEVNALYPHYLCPECKHSEFMEYEGSGVDLDDKNCPKCGTKYSKEGHTIPFEVFMGFNGDKVPDIDLNFSGEYQSSIHRYTEELFGKENVFKAGTISTLAEKNAFGYVKKYAEENEITMRSAEMLRLAKGCENVRKTTGQHPGGMIVVPQGHSIYEFCPVQKPANDQKSDSITTHFDYHVMDEQLVKLDILGHDDPTTIKLLQEYTGVDIYKVPLDDPETLKIFSSTESLGVTKEDIGSIVGTFGIPEFGTPFVRQMLVDTKPTTFAELVRISGLSHGTDVWLNNAQEYVRNKVAVLSEVISVRDDIMNYLIDCGIEKGKAFTIMEFVRKGKPTKDPDKWKEFAGLMKEHKVKDWYIESCQKIKYMFPKGHAVAYVMMAMRIAYFKVHYPLAFYAAFLSRKAFDFNSDIMMGTVDELRAKIKEINEKMKLDVKDKSEMTLLEILVELNCRGIELLGVDIYKSDAVKFVIEDDKIRMPLIAVNGLGEAVAYKIVEQRELGEFISQEDLIRRTKASKTVLEKLRENGAVGELSEFNQKQLF